MSYITSKPQRCLLGISAFVFGSISLLQGAESAGMRLIPMAQPLVEKHGVHRIEQGGISVAVPMIHSERKLMARGVCAWGIWGKPEDSDGDGIADFWDRDDDADGLRDWEEISGVEGNPTDSKISDTDHDGLADGVEIAGGYDPLDADSVLVIHSIARGPDGFEVQWEGRHDVDFVLAAYGMADTGGLVPLDRTLIRQEDRVVLSGAQGMLSFVHRSTFDDQSVVLFRIEQVER